MIRNVMGSLSGIDLYGIASMLIFISVFSVSFVWALRIKSTHCEKMKALPLEPDAGQRMGESTHD